MIGTTRRFIRLTGASLALMVALALGAGPGLAAQQKVGGGCLGAAVVDYGECLGNAGNFWDRMKCTVVLILDATDCVTEVLIGF